MALAEERRASGARAGPAPRRGARGPGSPGLRLAGRPPPPPRRRKDGRGGRGAAAGALKPWGSGEGKAPVMSRVLTGIVQTSAVPLISYLPRPATALHGLDARTKQACLVLLVLVPARASTAGRLLIAGFVLACTLAFQPRHVWRAQLPRIAALSLFLVVTAAFASDSLAIPVVDRLPGAALGADVPAPAAPGSYRYVLFNFWFLRVTRKSLGLALRAGAFQFTVLQCVSLTLSTTKAEDLVESLRWFLRPLRAAGVPVQEIALSLLLSLRFVSLVFEEVRNLVIGIASRGIDWRSTGRPQLLSLGMLYLKRLLANLFQHSERIADVMQVRGFESPANHELRHEPLPGLRPGDAAALAVVGGITAACYGDAAGTAEAAGGLARRAAAHAAAWIR